MGNKQKKTNLRSQSSNSQPQLQKKYSYRIKQIKHQDWQLHTNSILTKIEEKLKSKVQKETQNELAEINNWHSEKKINEITTLDFKRELQKNHYNELFNYQKEKKLNTSIEEIKQLLHIKDNENPNEIIKIKLKNEDWQILTHKNNTNQELEKYKLKFQSLNQNNRQLHLPKSKQQNLGLSAQRQNTLYRSKKLFRNYVVSLVPEEQKSNQY